MNREIDDLLKKIENSTKNTEKIEEENQFLKAENEFFKEELKACDFSKNSRLSFSKEILRSLPIEMSDFIQEKELENDLENLLINPQDLKIKKQIGSGGFATVYRFFEFS